MVRDLHHALRMMVRAPVLSAVVVLSLGVGIGVNTVVFSWLQGTIIHPLPGVAHSGRLHLIEPRSDRDSYPGMSWLEYRDLHDRLTSLPDLIAFRMAPFYIGEPGRIERTYGQLVSGNYFSALGVRPALGRFVRPEEADRPGTEPVAVISYSLWQSRYGGTGDVVGRTIRVNGRELIVIGVAPQRFQGSVLGLSFDLWVPATMGPVLLDGSPPITNRTSRGYAALGWLREDVPAASAQLELDRAMAQLAKEFPESNRNMRADLLTFWNAPRGPQRLFAAALAVLQGLMLLLLLAVCGNTANLVLARASARQREMGVRLALGASPWRAVRLMLSEHVVLSVIGGLLGFAIAAWWTPTLIALPLTGLPIRFQIQVDQAALAFAVVLGLACGILTGVAPAVQVSQLDPHAALRAGSQSAGRSVTRNVLMAVEVALAAGVLIVAGLFFRSFADTHSTDTGFRREGVLLAAYDLNGRPIGPDRSAFARNFASRLLAAMNSLSSVEAAAVSSSVPLDIHGLPSRTFTLEGHARTDGALEEAVTNTVTPGYLSLMKIPLVTGADFAALDDVAAPAQAIVNEEFARRYLDGGRVETVVGRRLESRGTTYVVVGVARNSLYNAFGEPPTPMIYLSYRDRPVLSGEIHVRARTGAEASITSDIRRVVRNLDPDLPLFNVRTLVDHVETNLVFRRVPARLFAILGPLLLVLAASGIYAVVSYTVSLRTREVGVRMALGASARRVVAEFLAEHLGVVIAGTVAGWLLTFVIALDVVGVDTIDASVFGGVPLLLLIVAGVACWIPARRATLVEPMVVLRED
jgi:putative ABC transport system permease protein